MTLPMILAPLFVQVLLTLGIGFLLFTARASALRGRQVRWQQIALGEPAWPPEAMQRANAFRNQFELPVLFYVLTTVAIISKHADVLFVAMAWLFVLSRVAHAVVHVTSNHVPTRGMLYGIGGLVLIIMWLIFIFRIMLGLP